MYICTPIISNETHIGEIRKLIPYLRKIKIFNPMFSKAKIESLGL